MNKYKVNELRGLDGQERVVVNDHVIKPLVVIEAEAGAQVMKGPIPTARLTYRGEKAECTCASTFTEPGGEGNGLGGTEASKHHILLS